VIRGIKTLAAGGVVVLVFASTTVRAQSGAEPDPCAHAFGQSDLGACWAREAERADDEMNQVYLALRKKLPKRGAKSLEKAQKLWKEFREAHLGTLYGVESPRATYGREYPICLSISSTTLTRARIRELRRLLEHDGETVCPL
jgi:uncharacterized protein YecT (DUF1311 family)